MLRVSMRLIMTCPAAEFKVIVRCWTCSQIAKSYAGANATTQIVSERL